MVRNSRLIAACCLLILVDGSRTYADESRFVDCSLLVAPEYPATWPTPFPRFQIVHQRTIGPDSAYNIDSLLIDGNTGTQLDVPPHSVARPDLNRPKSGPLDWRTQTELKPGNSAAKRVLSMYAICWTKLQRESARSSGLSTWNGSSPPTAQ
ncbi:MAG: hypothetical protein R3C19_13625 [Planctomycetaceae bacterium]